MELKEYREQLVIKELKADKDLEELLAFLDQLDLLVIQALKVVKDHRVR